MRGDFGHQLRDGSWLAIRTPAKGDVKASSMLARLDQVYDPAEGDVLTSIRRQHAIRLESDIVITLVAYKATRGVGVDRPVGYVQGMVCLMEAPLPADHRPPLDVLRILTVHDQRRQGIATALVAALENKGRRLFRNPQLRVLVDETDLETLAFLRTLSRSASLVRAAYPALGRDGIQLTLRDGILTQGDALAQENAGR